MSKIAGQRPLIFLWENFGPLHVDRCEAVAHAMPSRRVIGLEVLSESTDYDWISASSQKFEKITLAARADPKAWSPWRIAAVIARLRPEAVFFCHYQRAEIFLAATLARAMGVRVFTMNDSKFDDYPRELWREVAKSLFFLPYQGALAASRRSADYLRFFGIRKDRIAHGYDSISVARIRDLAKAPPAPDGAAFEGRHFTIVARLLPKKNIALALRALAILARAGQARKLVICGSGPLEFELKALAKDLGVSSLVDFKGFAQTEEVCRILAQTLVLILPSVEEQFGQVIPEALSMGVPVLVSDNCGARDHLVETGVNGFIFEPTNVEGLAYFMRLLSTDESTWRSMALAALRIAGRGDVSQFVTGVRQLVDGAIAPSLAQPPKAETFALREEAELEVIKDCA
ncbi:MULTISPECIES: glycosyltransferase family 4 protein [unclassified Caulobacter]|uniref:glycosyltransferase family 4 protein n=1 Tax=unclassified Caulobacter TaxID=2648921 RepID=UPI0012E3D0F8|nr:MULTISPECIES: glycosyltransferase [unclassified Caulobacter]